MDTAISHPASGYADPAYTDSLREFGTPMALAHCGGHVLVRLIPGTNLRDAMGAYPLFSCRDWSRIGNDIAELRHQHVSLTLVADPFGNHDEALLRQTFDRVASFKSHFIIELGQSAEEFVSKHHQYYARKALARVSVEVVQDHAAFLPEWIGLYDNLIRRHQLTGIKAFSPASFRDQLALPGLVALRAIHLGRTIGAHLWMPQGNVINSHLAAFSDEGYELMCAYAIYWEAIRHFTNRAAWLNIGTGAGLESSAQDGLTRFKRGWSTGTRPVYFCGTILDCDNYGALSAQRAHPDTTYFPAYRSGEFA